MTEIDKSLLGTKEVFDKNTGINIIVDVRDAGFGVRVCEFFVGSKDDGTRNKLAGKMNIQGDVPSGDVISLYRDGISAIETGAASVCGALKSFGFDIANATLATLRKETALLNASHGMTGR